MADSTIGALLISFGLIILSAFFVAAEYALVGSRRPRIESLAKKGNLAAKALMGAFDQFPAYIAGMQVALTMINIGIGAYAEPRVSRLLEGVLGEAIPRGVSSAVSILIVTFVLVVIGELVPKYLALGGSDRLALKLIIPLRWSLFLLRPLIWLVQRSGDRVLRLFGVRIDQIGEEEITREELMLMVRSGQQQGNIEETHAEFVTKALRFDQLDAQDVMIHRLDIGWLDIDTPKDQLFAKLGTIPHRRIPVCRGDIDEMVGVLYLQDVIRHFHDDDFQIERHLKPIEAIPENLTLDRIIAHMRESKSQILIVRDEYGGTSGLITLEDVVEEVFGELEDQMESERPPIERAGPHRISARAEVRLDRLMEFLKLEPGSELENSTDSLATVLADRLDHVPRLGDSVELPFGKLYVENMARRRITRVSVLLNPENANRTSKDPGA